MEFNEKNKSFDEFQKDVLKLNKHNEAIEHQFKRYNSRILLIASILVFFTNTFWILSSLISKSNFQDLSVAGIIVMIAVSVWMFIAAKLRKTINRLFYRITCVGFYIGLVVGVLLLNIGFNVRTFNNLADYDVPFAIISSSTGVSLATLFLFIIVFAPLYYKLDSIIVCVAVVAGIALPMMPFMPGYQACSVIAYVLILIYIVLCYWIMYMLNYRNALHTSELNELNKEFVSTSYTDSLTGAMNKRALYNYIDYLKVTFNGKKIFATIFDIDNFKGYNDSESHIKGDEVLALVCETAQSVLNKYGIYLFRYGGEEFVYFVLDTESVDAVKLALEIRKSVHDKNIIRKDNNKNITITFGIANEIVSDNGTDFILTADKNLYYGKDHDKDCVVYNKKIYR